MSTPRLLILETSHQPGVAALAAGEHILGQQRLDEARRHARDLAPAVAALLAKQNWRARDLDGVVVSRGPGSYTGLRVGIISAKTLAYATGCRLLAVETFAAIARQTPAGAEIVDVVADAQQDKVYVQRFSRTPSWSSASPLKISPFADWVATLAGATLGNVWVTGPALIKQRGRLPPGASVVAATEWSPRAESLLALGLERWERGERDDPFALEPLYLRPSSAEEKWKQRK